MKYLNWNKSLELSVRNALLLAIIMGPVMVLIAADAKDERTTEPATPAQQKAPADTKPQPPQKKLSGAELYSMHCNRCHPERYPTERTAAQWKTILMHMRVRANLPAEQARTILKYLQDNSGR